MIMSVTYTLHNKINYACDRRRCNFLLPSLPGMTNANRPVARSACRDRDRVQRYTVHCCMHVRIIYIDIYIYGSMSIHIDENAIAGIWAQLQLTAA